MGELDRHHDVISANSSISASSPTLENSEHGLSSPDEAVLQPASSTRNKRKNETQAERKPTKMSYTETTDEKGPKNDEKYNSQRKPGRKPIDGDLPAGASNSEKRRAQNRAAQRAFRERKERHVRELEERIQALEDGTQGKKNAGKSTSVNLKEENEKLRQMVERLAEENRTLKEAKFTFEMPFLSTVSPTTPTTTTTTATATATPATSSSSSSNIKQQLSSNVKENDQRSDLVHDAHLHTPPESSIDQCPGVDGDDGSKIAASVAAAATTYPALFGAIGTTVHSDPRSLAMSDSAILSLAATTAATHPPTTNLADWLFPQINGSQLPSPTAPTTAYASPLSIPSPDFASLMTTSSSVSGLISDPTLAPPLGLITPNSTAIPSVDTPNILGTLTDVSSSPFGASAHASDSAIFTQYRDTDELAALFGNPPGMTLPSDLGVSGGVAAPTTFQDELPSTLTLPLEELPGVREEKAETAECPEEKRQMARKLLEAVGVGRLDDAELDQLCKEMKSKCKASQKAKQAQQARQAQQAQQAQQAYAPPSTEESSPLGFFAKYFKS